MLNKFNLIKIVAPKNLFETKLLFMYGAVYDGSILLYRTILDTQGLFDYHRKFILWW